MNRLAFFESSSPYFIRRRFFILTNIGRRRLQSASSYNLQSAVFGCFRYMKRLSGWRGAIPALGLAYPEIEIFLKKLLLNELQSWRINEKGFI
jgi:hypothetical protein